MAATTEVLDFDIDTGGLLGKFRQLQKRADDGLKEWTKDAEKRVTKLHKKASDQSKSSFWGYLSRLDALSKAEEDHANSVRDIAIETSKLRTQLMQAEAKAFDAAATAEEKSQAKAAKKRIEAQIKGHELTLKQQQENVEQLQQGTISFRLMKLEEPMTKAGAALVAPLQALASKDLPEAFKSSAVLAGGALTHVLGPFSKKMGKVIGDGFGDRLLAKAAKMSAAGKSTKAMGVAGLGGIAKGMGWFSKLMGGMVSMLGKLGPLLGMVAGAFAGIIKVMFDAESAAKDFNKQVLSTTGTVEYLTAAGGNAAAGASDLRRSLDNLRDSAMDVGNIMRGIDKEKFLGVINALTQEGVSLKALEGQYERAAKSGQGYARDHKTMVQQVVAYSSNLGVSIQEIGQAQAEMMVDMGMSLASVEKTFKQIEVGAANSGMASNKFFQIIRSVSADLSLYNTRLEDTTKMLGVLGGAMNSRNAKQFLQYTMNAVKGMGRTQRLQTTMLAGGERTKKIVEQDIAVKVKGLAAEVGLDPDSMEGLTNDEKLQQINEAINTMGKDQQGALREAATKIAIQQQRTTKGIYGVGIAAGETGPIAQAQIIRAAITKFSGRNERLINQAGKLNLEALAEQQGVSVDQLDQIIQFEEALYNMAETDEERAAIARGDYQGIWSRLDDQTKQQIEGMGKDKDYAEKTSDFQTSTIQQLKMIYDVLFNKIYSLMQMVQDTLERWFGWPKSKDDGPSEESKVTSAVAAKGSKELSDALLQSSGSLSEFRKKVLMSTEWGKKWGDAQKKQVRIWFKNQSAEDRVAKLQEAASYAKISLSEKEIEAISAEMERTGGSLDKGLLETILPKVSGRNKGEAGEMAAALIEKLKWTIEAEDLVGMYQAPGTEAKPAATAATPPAKEAAKPTAPPTKEATKPAAPPPTKEDKSTAKDTKAVSKDQKKAQKSLASVDHTLKQSGIKISPAQIKGDLGTVLLDSIRTGLFEYYQYKDVDPAMMAQLAAKGLTGKDVAALATQKGVTGAVAATELAQKNAAGGLVTGVSNGIASVMRAPAGEGFASVGRGERIVPSGKGGGAQVIELRLRGDLKRFVEATAQNTVAKERSNKRLR